MKPTSHLSVLIAPTVSICAALGLTGCAIGPAESASAGSAGSDGAVAVSPPTPPPTPTAIVSPKPTFDAQCEIVLPPNYLADWRETAPSEVTVIGDMGRSWGRVYYQWHIERGGRGCLLSQPPYPAPVAKPEIKTFQVSDALFDEIATTLSFAKVKAQLSNCRQMVTDGPYGELQFYGLNSKAKLGWNGGNVCADSRGFADAQMRVLTRLQAMSSTSSLPK
jgi:hypothetical protein